jgi:hypothetical protein
MHDRAPVHDPHGHTPVCNAVSTLWLWTARSSSRSTNSTD